MSRKGLGTLVCFVAVRFRHTYQMALQACSVTQAKCL